MPQKKLSKIAKHNAWVRQQRKLGLLPYQDGTWRTPPKPAPPKPVNPRPPKFLVTSIQEIIADYHEQNAKKQAERDQIFNEFVRKIKISPHGSILNNKYACWTYPFSKLTKKDY